MSDIRHVRGIRLGGISLAGVAVLVGLAGPAAAAPDPAGARHPACTWAAHVLPTVPTTEFAFNGVDGTDGDETFAGYSNGHAVLWREGRLIDLGGGGAADVNRSGDAVGFQTDGNWVGHAVLFRTGTAIRLAEPANAVATRATGINDGGLIVGSAEFGGTAHALVWSASTPGAVTDLGTLDGDEANATWLAGVNEEGTLIGNVVNQNTLTMTAVIGTVGGGLRALPGSTPAADSITAGGISGRYVVGTQYVDGATLPVRWLNGRAHVLPGDAAAAGVNSNGTVVGQRSDGTSAVIWTGAGDPVDLPIPAGLTQPGATVITDSGTVAGFSSDETSGEARPVLWSCR